MKLLKLKKKSSCTFAKKDILFYLVRIKGTFFIILVSTGYFFILIISLLPVLNMFKSLSVTSFGIVKSFGSIVC